MRKFIKPLVPILFKIGWPILIVGVLIIANLVIKQRKSKPEQPRQSNIFNQPKPSSWSADITSGDQLSAVLSDEDANFLNSLPTKTQLPNSIRVPILLYHHIEPVPPGKSPTYYVEPAIFEQQMKWLVDNGYHALSISQFSEQLKAIHKIAEKLIVLTFDDGTIGQFTYAWPVLKKYHLSATFFVPVHYIDQGTVNTPTKFMNWAMVKELSAAGMDIGSHSFHHTNLVKLEPNAANREIRESKKILEGKLNRPVVVFAFPFGAFSDPLVNMVQQAGYTEAMTTEKKIDHRPDERYTLGRLHIDNDMKYFKARVMGKWFH